MKHALGMEIAIQVNSIETPTDQIVELQAEARFLTLPTIDFATLTSILLVKAAFLLGNVDPLLS